ncbi:FAD:protein FMN transferase [Paraglaciecola marina]|uniref:FAD:protein FMN transferase n=1 Tax=Paraglaciecola marina TaxID=2500157 RepID=UPI00105F3B62|nr:FAD:protein FMN transferase [Paraglaciecola marina]
MKKLFGLSCLLFIFAFYSASSFGQWFESTQGIMGTNIHVELWSDSAAMGEAATEAVMDEMRRIDSLMSPYKPSSELSKLNAEASLGPVVVSEELYDLISLAIELSQETQGAFDITFASVGFLYDYRENQKPEQENIDELLPAIDFRHIKLSEATHSIFFAHKNVKIDLGGIAKGHAVDNSIHILQQMGIKYALVTAGGDTRLLGNRLDKPWMVGIRDPRNKNKQAVVLPLADIALSTSGDYERYFEEDGKRYHHILSPKTGKSAFEVQSVSIIGPSSTLNDGLSTAVFVLGVQKGMDLLNRTPGYDGIILDNARKLHYSNALIE